MLQVYPFPERKQWPELCRRPVDESRIESAVRDILNAVRDGGDKALRKLTLQFDCVAPKSLVVSTTECERQVPPELAEAIDMAKQNIEAFHKVQLREEQAVETRPGVVCWRRAIPLQRVGLYIPGGTAPLFSTLLMLGIPARLAGCPNVVVCTPPQRDGSVHPVVAHTAELLGIKTLYLAGGAQAIAAMAYGTETIPRVDKIFGPGNAYVTAAKQLVQRVGVAIDMPAGPSEVLVIADAQSNPAFVAADLLSQAEHGSDSQVVLVTDSQPLISHVQQQLVSQMKDLPRAALAANALKESKAILVNDSAEAIAFSNVYAPEHLIINTRNPERFADQIVHAGSVFLGPYSCESAGDYCSGTNHTLPTNGFARSYSGVSVESFTKTITFQTITRDGLRNIGPAVMQMANAEQLQAHGNAVSIRLKEIENV